MEQQILTCTKCGKAKPETDFHVCRRRKTGRQGPCKECQNKITTTYRKETEGAYWKHKENDPFYIYTITSPDNKVYVGFTSTRPNLRWRRHLAQYKLNKTTLYLLYESFDKFGTDTHTFQVVDQASTKEKARLRESELILRYKNTDNSLNVHCSAFRVGQYDKKTGELIKIWDSIRDAATEIGKSKSTQKGKYFYHTYIRLALTDRNRSGKTLGYLWKILPFENGYYFDPRKKETVEESK